MMLKAANFSLEQSKKKKKVTSKGSYKLRAILLHWKSSHTKNKNIFKGAGAVP